MRLYFDKNGIVKVATDRNIVTNLYKYVDVDISTLTSNPVGKKISFRNSQNDGMKVAVICNWGDECGIATYSRYLLEALSPLVSDVRVFAEKREVVQGVSPINVEYLWKRGQSMVETIQRIVEWGPSIVLIQHEFGIFPKATHLLKMFQMLDDNSIPYVVTLHSVYQHLDKVICSAPMKNIVVHSKTGKDCLNKLGHKSNIQVIPHGCVVYDNVQQNWNILHTPHSIIQFGFGFTYKGVEVALEAVYNLRKQYPDIHYCYLCSESPHVKNVNNEYYKLLRRKVDELKINEHVVIIRGFQTEDVLNQYLRTYKVAVFPYVPDPKNVVFGASGAARIAMANRIPTIVSTSPMFDDLYGVLIRCGSVDALSASISIMFEHNDFRKEMVAQADNYIKSNSWDISARRYLDFFNQVVKGNSENTILI